MTHPNEQFKLCRLDDAEVAQIEREARRIAWWEKQKRFSRDFRYPVIHRYVKKIMKLMRIKVG